MASIVEHTNDAIFSRRFDGVVTTWNAAAARIFGYAAEEIIGRSSRVLLPPGYKDEYSKLTARLRRGHLVEHFETERVCKDGTRIPVSLTLSAIHDVFGRPIGFSTIARDISEARRMRKALTHREEEMESLFEEASVGLLMVSPDRIVLRSNPALQSMLERNAEDIRGRPLKAFHPEAEVINSLFEQLGRRETIHNFPTEFRTAKGDTRFVRVDATGLWENGRLTGSRWFVRDVTRRHRLERELLETGDRERRRFAQDLHDGLGQQLGGIAYLLNVLREQLDEQALPEADNAAHILDLVRGAIEQTRRLARGLSPIREAPEGLMEALRELADQTCDPRRIQCRFHCSKPAPVHDTFVAEHLFRIAQEAVHNAVRHGQPRRITVSLRRAKTKLTLSVIDDGKGISPLSPNRKGIGLRAMQYRAALIRGMLAVTSRKPRGTKVCLTVPMPAHRAQRSQPKPR